MTAYKFTAHKQLRQLLDDAEFVQKRDIKSYAGGHLNQANLFRPPTEWGNQKWNKTNTEPLSTRCKSKNTMVVSTRPPTETDHRMKDVLYDFSIGTSGSLPTHHKQSKYSPRKFAESRTSTRKCPSASSEKSLYTEMEHDGVYVEELRADEMMLTSPRVANYKGKKLPPVEDSEYTIMEDLAKSLAEEGLLTFRHTFLPTHHMGVTKKDQYIKLMNFETDILRKKEANEKKVLSGERAVRHLEERLQQELDSMNFFDMGPNFHKLQIYSNTFEDLIEDSPTFVYILRAVKTEYDNYISKLLDTQTPQHSKLLREQVEQMASRGTSRPVELQEAKDKVAELEQKAKDRLEENEKLRRLVEEEAEWLANVPEPVQMTAYKFTAHKQLRQLLDDAEFVQKRDIKSYAGGHLNQANLFRPPTEWGNQKWNKTNTEPLSTRCKSKNTMVVSTRPPTETDHRMKDVLYDFSIGTSGSLPTHHKQSKYSPRKFAESRTSTRKCPSASSEKSLYTEMEHDGVYVEELRADEMMLTSPRVANYKGKKLPPVEDSEYTIMEDLAKSLAEEGLLTFRHTFLPTHHMGVTKKDQYIKLMNFETDILRKKEANEKKVLSGERAVRHLEERLQQELDSMNFFDMGPNFHKLQIYSNTFEDLIEDSPTFVYILRAVKTEYDNYISKLLDTQTPQHSKLLREQVEQMASRGTSRPVELQEAKDKVAELEQKAKDRLEENEKLRRLVEEEAEWLANVPEPDLQRKRSSVCREEGPAELADEIEHAKALILEKLDDLNSLRTKLREQYVPLTVCTHLEQCIKETEVEVQKLLKQNEYFERSIDEMEGELKESIQQADTSERDAKRIWRKVNSRRGLPHIPGMNGGLIESDDDEDDESKWNWYIS